MNQYDNKHNRPQVKICGLTDVDQALACARLGANAIGLIFFPKSPRHLTEEKARDISTALPSQATSVGVFVNRSFSDIMRIVENCHLKAAQLHGQETPNLVNRLQKENVLVVKALFIGGKPSLEEAPGYHADGFLVEHAGGKLPGGNALKWHWETVKEFGKIHPLILAGGISPDNAAEAIKAAQPDVLDVSSGVESSPGQKNIEKVRKLMTAIASTKVDKTLRTIY